MEKYYSIKEEIANSITHGTGAVLSLLGLLVLILATVLSGGSTLTLISTILYGTSLFIMYLSSTLYHSFSNKKIKARLRTLDHCSIFLLIAGSYTPFTLITLKGGFGYSLFAILWIVAIFGVVLNIIDVKKYSKISLICYLIMGWSAIFAIKPLFENLNPLGIFFLVLGGVFYSVGVPFYLQKRKKYMHSVWHIFVLLGSVFHYLTILFFVI